MRYALLSENHVLASDDTSYFMHTSMPAWMVCASSIALPTGFECRRVDIDWIFMDVESDRVVRRYVFVKHGVYDAGEVWTREKGHMRRHDTNCLVNDGTTVHVVRNGEQTQPNSYSVHMYFDWKCGASSIPAASVDVSYPTESTTRYEEEE